MSKYIEGISIKSYRGIRNLNIDKFSDINILVGNNNCGKTSLLEAIKILSQPYDIGNIIQVINSRSRRISSHHFIDSIVSAFKVEKPDYDEQNKNMRDSYYINLSGIYNNKHISLEILGDISKEMDIGISQDFDSNLNKVFEGTMKVKNDSKNEMIQFSIKPNESIKVDMREKTFNALLMFTNVSIYESCIVLYPEVIQEDKKELFIEVLQIFDNNISDISITDDIIWIHNKEKGTMPIFTYGTGMQKALLMSLVLVKSSGGVLLIDEIETAIHTSALEELFEFIIKACKKLKVQLFATTHSLEAVDKLLGSAGYNNIINDKEEDEIRIITMRSSNNKTRVKSITGKQAYIDRKEYEMELRI